MKQLCEHDIEIIKLEALKDISENFNDQYQQYIKTYVCHCKDMHNNSVKKAMKKYQEKNLDKYRIASNKYYQKNKANILEKRRQKLISQSS